MTSIANLRLMMTDASEGASEERFIEPDLGQNYDKITIRGAQGLQIVYVVGDAHRVQDITTDEFIINRGDINGGQKIFAGGKSCPGIDACNPESMQNGAKIAGKLISDPAYRRAYGDRSNARTRAMKYNGDDASANDRDYDAEKEAQMRDDVANGAAEHHTNDIKRGFTGYYKSIIRDHIRSDITTMFECCSDYKIRSGYRMQASAAFTERFQQVNLHGSSASIISELANSVPDMQELESNTCSGQLHGMRILISWRDGDDISKIVVKYTQYSRGIASYTYPPDVGFIFANDSSCDISHGSSCDGDFPMGN